MLDGFKNEFDFCRIFNDKFCYQLDMKYIKFLNYIFDKEIDSNTYMICYKNVRQEKVDIILRVGSEKKYISIKSGKNNSVHLEKLSNFIKFLKSIGCSNKSINTYIKYHEGIGREGKRISAKELQELYYDELLEMNKEFNSEIVIKHAIDRFLLNGINNFYDVDVFVYGTPDNFSYYKKEDIINYLLSRNDILVAPHFSSMIIQPWTRNINNNPKYEYRRDYIQIKWYRLEDISISLEK